MAHFPEAGPGQGPGGFGQPAAMQTLPPSASESQELLCQMVQKLQEL